VTRGSDARSDGVSDGEWRRVTVGDGVSDLTRWSDAGVTQ